LKEIKFIPNEDFITLCELALPMYKAIRPETNAFQAVNTLIHNINSREGFLAVGAYDEGKLVGFLTGYTFDNSNTFYFDCLYMSKKDAPLLKDLIDFSIAHIKTELGFTSWILDAYNENMASMAEKYEAKIESIRYKAVM